MKQLEGMLSVRTLRMVMFTFCLYSCLSSDSYFGLGLGWLEIHLRYRNGKHT